mgnify:CR=1 FL=1
MDPMHGMWLPEEVWSRHVLQHAMNVNVLQRVRAVSKGFRETVDARVMNLIDSIRDARMNEGGMNETEPDVPDDEVATAELALETAANWVVLTCVAEKRRRQKKKAEIYKVYQATVCDMHGKAFMHHWTAIFCGKLSCRKSMPRNFAKIVVRMEVHDVLKREMSEILQRPLKAGPFEYEVRKGVEKYDEQMMKWVVRTVGKLAHGLPQHCDRERAVANMTTMLKNAMFHSGRVPT